MKLKLTLIAFLSILISMGFSSCSKDDDSNKDIIVTSGQLQQTVYADNTAGTSSVSFSTTGAWTSSITKEGADASDWISISASSGYEAGNYTINITLTPNYTGSKRSATINITCNESKISISVSQESITQSGGKPLKCVSEIQYRGIIVLYTFTYDNQTRLKRCLFSDFWSTGTKVVAELTYNTDGTITIDNTFDGSTSTMQLNSDKFVSTLSGYSWYDQMNITYSNGYMTSCTYSQATINNYVWDNGNLTSYTNTQSGTYIENYTYLYGTKENNTSNIDVNQLVMMSSGFDYIPNHVLYATFGYFGKRSKYLITSETHTQYDGNVKTTTFRYVTNSDGQVTEIYAKLNNEPELLKNTITYK